MGLLESCSPHLSQLSSAQNLEIDMGSNFVAIALLDAVIEIRLCTQLASPCFVLCWISEISIIRDCIYSLA